LPRFLAAATLFQAFMWANGAFPAIIYPRNDHLLFHIVQVHFKGQPHKKVCEIIS
jgi:hypothetical protein